MKTEVVEIDVRPGMLFDVDGGRRSRFLVDEPDEDRFSGVSLEIDHHRAKQRPIRAGDRVDRRVFVGQDELDHELRVANLDRRADLKRRARDHGRLLEQSIEHLRLARTRLGCSPIELDWIDHPHHQAEYDCEHARFPYLIIRRECRACRMSHASLNPASRGPASPLHFR